MGESYTFVTIFFQEFLPTFSTTPFLIIIQTAVWADLLFEYNGASCSNPKTSGRFENFSANEDDLSLTLFSSALVSHVVINLLPHCLIEANMSQSPMSLANSLSSSVTTSFPVPVILRTQLIVYVILFSYQLQIKNFFGENARK